MPQGGARAGALCGNDGDQPGSAEVCEPAFGPAVCDGAVREQGAGDGAAADLPVSGGEEGGLNHFFLLFPSRIFFLQLFLKRLKNFKLRIQANRQFIEDFPCYPVHRGVQPIVVAELCFLEIAVQKLVNQPDQHRLGIALVADRDRIADERAALNEVDQDTLLFPRRCVFLDQRKNLAMVLLIEALKCLAAAPQSFEIAFAKARNEQRVIKPGIPQLSFGEHRKRGPYHLYKPAEHWTLALPRSGEPHQEASNAKL